MNNRKAALGKGLGALLGGKVPSAYLQANQTSGTPSDKKAEGVTKLSIKEIKANPYQPRQKFREEALQELKDSILNHGILQPVLVTKNRSGQGYTLVAGERRLRAAELANLTEIPVIISDISDENMLEIAIIENVQRDDLNAVEEAMAYRALADKFGWSHEEIAQRVGKNRTTVVNSLRLLKLSSEALKDLEEGHLTAGHARAILSIDDTFYRQKLRQEIISKKLSVRQAEKLAHQYQKSGPPTKKNSLKTISPGDERLDIVNLQDRLMEHLGCRVKISTRDGKSGTLEIPFLNHEELERFFQAINFDLN